MTRKLFAALMLVAALAAVSGGLPGLPDNAAWACNVGNPLCG